jgi:hypothetical protein
MQTSTPWITLVSPTVGTGPATVSFQVANNTDGQRRVGSIVIAGITFLVAQNPPADLAAFIPPPDTDYCRMNFGTAALTLMVGVRNQGGAAAPAFGTTVTFATSGGPAPQTVTTTGLAAGASTDLSFQVPNTCFSAGSNFGCSFTIAVDPNLVVAESNENNNTAAGVSCSNPG